jgi:hypothetical protein
LLPDSPLTAFFLSKDMKIVAVERMRLEQVGIENKRFKLEQVNGSKDLPLYVNDLFY